MIIGIGNTIPEIVNLPGQGGEVILLTISYPSSAFCPSASDPTPTVSGNVGAGTFSAGSGLQFLDTGSNTGSSTGVVDISNTVTGTYTITYTDTNSAVATTPLTLNALDNASFSYSASSFPQDASNPSPVFPSGAITDGTFSAGSGLIFVDSGSNTASSTGEINLSASTIASYTITYDTTSSPSTVCPNTSTFTVAVTAAVPALAQINNVYSMQFDGINEQYIDLGDFTSVLGETSKFSTSLWCNWLGAGISRNGMLNFAPSPQGGTGTTFDMRFETSTNIKITIDNTAFRFFASPSPSNSWMHIVFTYDGSLVSGSTFDGVKLYINGAEATTSASGSTGTINPTINFASMFGFVGYAQNLSENRKWDGGVDEVGIFKSVLSSPEVLSIYNATEVVGGVNKTADLNTLTTPPVKWYRMGD